MRTIYVITGVFDEVIPRDELVKGEFYTGEGRFIQGVALWDGELFHGFQNKFGQYLQTTAEYGTAGFDPICRIKRVTE